MTDFPILSKIDSPTDIKSLNRKSLKKLSVEISKYIQQVVEEVGGHYSSPLGVVDLTLALHSIYNSPKDKMIWDVGHQAYAHKIITGRRDEFKNMRTKNGISGFLKREESPHDIFGAGHASTSISAALGFAHARDIKKTKDQIIAIIGDGAMTGGLAYEGINNLGYHRTQLTIVLNDNSHSISKSVGALSHYLTRVVTNPTYNKMRNDIWDISGKLPLSDHIRKIMRKTEEGIKGYLTPGALFEELGLRYIGPVNGHDLDELIRVFTAVKEMKTPVLVHVNTHKGKGSYLAEKDAIKYYSMGGKTPSKNGSTAPDYSHVFGTSLAQLAEKDEKIFCITAAMEIGTGMSPFTQKFPERFIDVGIAEEHAVTYSAGLAAEGLKPIVPIYSTFMQRAYDHIFHDALLQKLPVVYCMDRAGVVGPDGPTHHGVFDIAFMRSLPGMIVTAPKDGNELRNLLATGLHSKQNFSIRYPKDSSIIFEENKKAEILEIGSWERLTKGENTAILAVGSMVGMIMGSIDIIEHNLGYLPTVVNCRFIKPVDEKILSQICSSHPRLLTIEEGSLNGGFGSAVSDFLHDNGYSNALSRMGIGDAFVDHGTRAELLAGLNLTPEGVTATLQNKEKIYAG
ncbi:MAG: 1-deoxy-D-xylulose-5-phosphate synthase [Candidatus Marinimicrobia bacterium]|nr:1-deoxy-D-xylulose-5-phosphate synthase [Candidatus Neomarinimicrobiota bacterium]